MPHTHNKVSHHRKPYSTLSQQQRWLRRKEKLHNKCESIPSGVSELCVMSEVLSLSCNRDPESSICTVVNRQAVGTCDKKVVPNSIVDAKQQSSAMFNAGMFASEILDNQVLTAESSDTLKCMCSSSIQQIVFQWAMEKLFVPKQSVTRLLQKLNLVFGKLPVSYHGLVSKPDLVYERMLCGEYCHFSNWTSALKTLLDFYFTRSAKNSAITYFLLVNVDGLPLFRHSSDYKLYPILVSIYGISMRPLCAGIYCSNKSENREMPPPIFLPKFLDDINGLFANPIVINTRTFCLGNKGIYVCDAPARASLKQIKSHTGYSACERCTVIGSFCETSRHICFLDCSCSLRTNESFQLQTDKQHHRGKSILCDFGIKMVSNFVLDYMHLSCLGTMKRLFMWWLGKRCNKKKKGKLSPSSRKLLDNAILSAKDYISCEFNRKMRSIADISYWKAAEHRLFLLYAGLIILRDRNILSKQQYVHFFKFAMSMRQLISRDTTNEVASNCQIMLKQFVQECVDFYGSGFVSHNTHCLIHVVDDFIMFGSLDTVNSFPFESF